MLQCYFFSCNSSVDKRYIFRKKFLPLPNAGPHLIGTHTDEVQGIAIRYFLYSLSWTKFTETKTCWKWKSKSTYPINDLIFHKVNSANNFPVIENTFQLIRFRIFQFSGAFLGVFAPFLWLSIPRLIIKFTGNDFHTKISQALVMK